MTSQTIDVRYGTSSLGDPLSFCNSPVSLKEMTTFKLAIEFWFKYNSVLLKDRPVLGGNEIYELFDDVRKIRECDNKEEILNLVENLPLPGQIRSLIKHGVKTVCERVAHWLCTERDIFTFNSTSYKTSVPYSTLGRYLRCLAWEPNGEINYEKTAKNLLPEIDSVVMKYKVMTYYCFEDEIRNMSSEELKECEQFPDSLHIDMLEDYWREYVRNGCYKSIRSNLEDLLTGNDVHTWSAVEYFWDQLNNDQRLPVANILLTSKWIVRKNQKRLLLKLTESQRNEIIARIPVTIITNFWLYCSEFDVAFILWIRLRDKMTGSQFISLINTILHHRINSSQEEDATTLMEIWRTAPDHLRSFIFTSDVSFNVIVEAYFTPISLRFYPSPRPRNMTFLISVLSFINSDRRSKLIIDRGLDLVINNDPASAYEVVKFCFDSSNSALLLDFKKSLMESSVFGDHCSKSLSDGDIKRLNSVFELFSPDLNSGAECRKRLIESYNIGNHRRFIFQPEEWKDLCDFIDGTYYNDPHLATSVKKQFIFASSANCVCLYKNERKGYEGFWHDSDCLKEIIDVVENFLSNEEMIKFKRDLLAGFVEKLHEYPFWYDFNQDGFHEFEKWCLGNEEDILKFKLSLSVDDIFNKIFTTECYDYDGDPECPSVNIVAAENFLKWYFASPQQIREYKLRRINHFKKDDTLREFFNNFDDYLDLQVMLPWFFDGDEEQIRRFQSKHKKDTLAQLISVPVQVHDYRLLAFESRIRFSMQEYYQDGYW